MGPLTYTSAEASARADECDRLRAEAVADFDRDLKASLETRDFAEKKARSDFAGLASCTARHWKKCGDNWRVLAMELAEREEAAGVDVGVDALAVNALGVDS